MSSEPGGRQDRRVQRLRRLRREIAVDHSQIDAATIGEGGQCGVDVGQGVEAGTPEVSGEAVAVVGHGKKDGRTLHRFPSVWLGRLRTPPLLAAPTRTTMGPGPTESRQRYSAHAFRPGAQRRMLAVQLRLMRMPHLGQ